MSFKSFIVLFLLFALQTIMSCDTCNCPSLRTYSIEFQGLEVGAYQHSLGQIGEINGTMSFSELTLVTNVSFESARIANCNTTLALSSAMACDCVFPEDHEFVDAISFIRILKTEQEVIEDVSVLFGVDESFDLDWFVSNNLFASGPEQMLSLQFNALDNATLLGTMTLTVEIELESGAILSATTQEITFTD